jgi:hypothetical protein
VRLLSVLLGIGLVLGLTVFVVDKMGDEGKKTNDELAVKVLPGGIVAPNTDPPGGASSGGAVAAANTVACATAAQALRSAEEQYQVLNGKYADLPTLVAAKILRAQTRPLYTIESTDGFATFTLVGQSGCP